VLLSAPGLEMGHREQYAVEPGKHVSLKSVDPAYKGHHESSDAAKEEIEENRKKLAELQVLLWAEKKHSLLIVLQAMDAGGKDGTVKHVLGAFNPQGTGVTGFKVPTAQEASHDFLWRVHPHAPSKGYIAIFNRSQYEDVLAPRVHGLIGKSVWEERYRHIRNFEQLLADNSTHIVKFYLHISREEQLERFAARLEDPQRNWKISDSDYSERPHWNEYMAAYEDAISATSTALAPWYVIPSNHKWYRNLAVSRVIVEALEELKMSYPKPQVDLRDIRRKYHSALKDEKSVKQK
jgi:PPK2 family polyphosphate:nucleotide phosphotransferase